MDPFHVVRLAGDALNDCRRRVQQTTRGRHGRKNDPLHRARRTLHTGAGQLTDKQAARLTARADGQADRVAQRRRPRAAGRDRQARPHPEQASR